MWDFDAKARAEGHLPSLLVRRTKAGTKPNIKMMARTNFLFVGRLPLTFRSWHQRWAKYLA